MTDRLAVDRSLDVHRADKTCDKGLDTSNSKTLSNTLYFGCDSE